MSRQQMMLSAFLNTIMKESCFIMELNLMEWNINFGADKNAKICISSNTETKVIYAENKDDVCIELHFNSAKNSTACGTEVILSENPTDEEVKIGVQLLNTTAKALGTNVRSIKTERQTPHNQLAILHLPCSSIILEVCFCSNLHDSEIYFHNREKLAAALAKQIALIANKL